MPRVPFLRVLRKTGHGGTALCPRWVRPGRFTCPTPAGSWVGAGCPRRPLVPAAPRGRPPRSSRQGTQAGGEPAGPRQQEPPLGGRAADFPQRTWDQALRTSGTECPSTPLTAPVLTGSPDGGIARTRLVPVSSALRTGPGAQEGRPRRAAVTDAAAGPPPGYGPWSVHRGALEGLASLEGSVPQRRGQHSAPRPHPGSIVTTAGSGHRQPPGRVLGALHAVGGRSFGSRPGPDAGACSRPSAR